MRKYVKANNFDNLKWQETEDQKNFDREHSDAALYDIAMEFIADGYDFCYNDFLEENHIKNVEDYKNKVRRHEDYKKFFSEEPLKPGYHSRPVYPQGYEDYDEDYSEDDILEEMYGIISSFPMLSYIAKKGKYRFEIYTMDDALSMGLVTVYNGQELEDLDQICNDLDEAQEIAEEIYEENLGPDYAMGEEHERKRSFSEVDKLLDDLYPSSPYK